MIEMKKIFKYVLSTLLILTILVVIFWQQLITTIAWSITSSQSSKSPTTFVTPEQRSLLISEQVDHSNVVEFNDITIPIIFNNADVTNTEEQIVSIQSSSQEAVYFVSKLSLNTGVFSTEGSDLTDEEFQIFCDSVMTQANEDPCRSGYLFMNFIFGVTPNSHNSYSSESDKKFGTFFLKLKDILIPSETTNIYEFTTKYARGYLLVNDTTPIQAFIFPSSSNDGYEVVFGKTTLEQAEYILTNTL